MADEGNESTIGRMDLNLYLGLPRSPRPRSSDLGSDLALSSLPLSTSSTTEESRAPLEMSSALEPRDSHAPYSPSHASFTPQPSIGPNDPNAHANDNPNEEYTPYSPSYTYSPRFGPYAPIPEPLDPGTAESPPPSNPHPLPTLQETEEEPHDAYPPSYTPSYIPLETQETGDELSRPYVPPPLQDVSMYAPPMTSYAARSPPYDPRSPIYPPMEPSYVDRSPPYDPRSPSYNPPRDELLSRRDDESSSRRDILESPEFRLRRLIESSHRLRLRRFRSSLPYHGSDRPGFERSASPVPEQQLMHDIMTSHRSLETSGKHKVRAEGIAPESSEGEKEDETKSAANFECNICLDMAQEPVVTSCGHLFCWPCLYQWLNVHSDHKECPVCKGEVTESNITPIYGRGSSEASDGKTLAESGESNIKIPPRPRGNRFESLRQQFRPISRRFGDWRRLVNQQLRNRNRFDGHGDLNILNGAQQAVLTRLRARRMLREELNAEAEHEGEDIRVPRDTTIPQSNDTNPIFRDGVGFWHRDRERPLIPHVSDTHAMFYDGIDIDNHWHRQRESSTTIPRYSDDPLPHQRDEFWHRVSMYGLYAPADVGRVVGNGTNRHGASSSSMNPQTQDQLIPRVNLASGSTGDQVSASSTTAVIQGDVGVAEGSAEPTSAGSSRSYRRRGRSSASGSLDVDGGVLHASKRRRLN